MADEGAFRKSPGTEVTQLDVARAAGVSPATVSRYLNNPAIVRPAVAARVEAAIRTLDYLPHGAARSLASRRSRMIGAVFPSLDNALFGGALEALQTELADAGYTLVVGSSNYDAKGERDLVRNLMASGIDALMLVGAAHDDAVYRLIARRNMPYVLTWVSQAPAGRPCIGFDNHAAAAMVARHLMDMGHRHLAMISGYTQGNDRAAARVAGVCDALAERGLALAGDRLIECPFGVTEGRDAFRRLMATGPTPTAVICGSEPFAYGALFESAAMGIDVPGDVSVTGFDDMWLAAQIKPGLTTVRTPRTAMGRLAGQYLLAVLAGQETMPPRPLEVELIVRGSTAPPVRP